MSADPDILETEKEIVDEFGLFDSWDDKYEYIIDLGKNWLRWILLIKRMITGSGVASHRFG